MARSTIQYDGATFDYVGGTISSFPGGGGGSTEIDYVQATSNVNVTGTTASGATTVITGNAHSYDGSTRIKIEFFAPTCTPGSQFTDVTVWDGSTDLGVIIDTVSEHQIYGVVFYTPSSGSHTFTIRAFKGSGTSTIYGGSGGTSGQYLPMWYRITTA